jgi:hypothetical protein
MGASERDRGARWERALVAWLRDRGITGAERAGSGHRQHGGDIIGVPGVLIEARDRGALSLGAWSDATREAALGRHWAVVCRRRGTSDVGRALVVMDLVEWVTLLAAAGVVSTEQGATEEERQGRGHRSDVSGPVGAGGT